MDRSLEDRVLVLETLYQEHTKQIFEIVSDIKSKLDSIATGSLPTCMAQNRRIESCELQCSELRSFTESRVKDLEKKLLCEVGMIWSRIWWGAGLLISGVVAAGIYHITHL